MLYEQIPKRTIWRGGISRRGLAAVLAVVWCLAFGLASAVAQSPAEVPPAGDPVNQQYEYNVKAAFIYSFGRYVEWPESAFAGKDAPFVIGVFGENPFGDVLDHIAKTKTIQDRRIVVRKVDSMDGLSACHILFVPRSATVEQQRQIAKSAAGKPLLLVGETQKFADFGGNVNFFLDGARVRFEINVEAIRREKMQINAKLLILGKKNSSAGGSSDQAK
jgi:hypothetical protein